MKPGDRRDDPASAEPFHNPFRSLRDKLQPARTTEAPVPVEAAPAPLRLPSKVVMRLERKGRSGKVVTCIELRGLPSQLLGGWLQELKRVLGCGGSSEGGTLVLQGDQRQRLKSLFFERGVRSISLG